MMTGLDSVRGLGATGFAARESLKGRSWLLPARPARISIRRMTEANPDGGYESKCFATAISLSLVGASLLAIAICQVMIR
ncbi:hypothetical protein DXT77_24965 [Pseudomonas sp. 91RF]|nr:hypothetical protein DXT77_24965 [Pseudomonas sp. 91RF]